MLRSERSETNAWMTPTNGMTPTNAQCKTGMADAGTHLRSTVIKLTGSVRVVLEAAAIVCVVFKSS